MAQEWVEVLDKRNRTSKTKRLYVDGQPTNKCLLETNAGSLHYLDAGGAWQDVDVSAEEPDSDGFTVKFTKLSYFGRIDDEGRRRFYPDRNDLSYWIEFKKPYPNMGLPTRQNRWFYWDFAHAVIGVRFDIDRLKFGFRLKDDQAPTSITIPFETQGITRQGRFLLHDGAVVATMRKPTAVDALGMEKDCQVTFGPGEVTISLDPTDLEYPIEIDPSIDPVSETGDGFIYGSDPTYATARATAAVSDITSAGMNVGQKSEFMGNYDVYRSFLKFDTSALPDDCTIDQVNLKMVCYDDSSASADFDVQIVKQDWSGEDPITAGNRDTAYDNCLGGAADDNIWRNTSGIVEETQYASGNLSTAWPSKTGNTYYSLRSSKDFDNDDPDYASNEFITLGTREHGTEGFRPVLSIEYSEAGGEEYSLVIGAGSYAIAGTAAGMPVGRVMGAAGGSYAVTGAAAGLLRDLLIGAGAGSYALSGGAVGFPVDRVIGAASGSYSLTGATVALLRDMLMSAAAGNYAITGTAVPFVLGMSAGPGAYNITGAAVTLLKDMLISAAAGAYAITGSAAGLKRGLVITADGGTYTLSGAAVSLLLDWILSAGAGAYVISGADAALLRTLIMAAAGGTYALTGADVALLRGKIMAAEGGSYAITGSDIDLLKAMILAMGAGTYTITGQESSLRVTVGVVLPIIGVLRAIDMVEGVLVEKDKTRTGLSTGRPKGVIN